MLQLRHKHVMLLPLRKCAVNLKSEGSIFLHQLLTLDCLHVLLLPASLKLWKRQSARMLWAGVFTTKMVSDDPLYSAPAVATVRTPAHSATNVIETTSSPIPLTAGWTLYLSHPQACRNVATSFGSSSRCIGTPCLKLSKQVGLVAELFAKSLQFLIHKAPSLIVSLLQGHTLYFCIIKSCTGAASEMRIRVCRIHPNTAAITEMGTALGTRHVVAPSTALDTNIAIWASLRFSSDFFERP